MDERKCWVCKDNNEVYESGMCVGCYTWMEDKVVEGALAFDAPPDQVVKLYNSEHTKINQPLVTPVEGRHPPTSLV